ncbi:MAG: RICIN domain-containing protein [Coriobacteriia bacterium]|nr:RICIN domain-containing protein [Coriobacteriia bacterium]
MNYGTYAIGKNRVVWLALALILVCFIVAAPTHAFAEEVSEGATETVEETTASDTGAGDGEADAPEAESLQRDEADADDETTEGGSVDDGAEDNGASQDAGDVEGEPAIEVGGTDSDVSAQVSTADETTLVEIDETVTTAEDGPSEAANEDGAELTVDASVADEPKVVPAAAVAANTAVASTPAKTKAKAKRAPAQIKAGWYSIRTALNSKYFVQSKNSKSKNGTKIILKQYCGAIGQAFRVVKVANYYRIMCGSGNKSRIHVAADGKVTLVRTGSYNTLFTLMKEGDSQYRLVNLATGKALAIANDRAGSGVSLVAQTSVAGKKSQTFIFQTRHGVFTDDVYTIRTVLTGKRALSPYKGKLKAKVNSALTTYDNKLYQKWQIKAVAGKQNVYTIENIATGCRLTGASGKPAKLYKASNALNQWWKPIGINGKVIFKNTGTGNVLQLYNGAYTAGTLTTCVKQNNAKKQRWTVKRVQLVGSGVYELDLAANRSLALEIPESSTAQNAQVKTWDDIDTSNQRWYYDASSKTLTNVNSGKVLTVKGSAVAGANAVQADLKDTAVQKWVFSYLGNGKFRLTSMANSSLALNAAGTTRASVVNVTAKSGSNTQAWRLRQAKADATTYINLGFSLDQMARWQKAGNSYLSGYTISYIKSVLNPANGSKYKFLDLRKSTKVSASALDKFINRYGSTGKLKGLGKTFVDACKTYKIDHSYLLAHAILESDWGRSELASGYKYKGGYIDGKYYKKGTYYNFFGIGAYDSSPLSGGRKLAIINGWNSPAKAVSGAAKWISRNYIYATSFDKADRYPQNTLYSMKWDLGRTKAKKQYGWHQYATSTTWADSIGNLIGQILVASGNSTSLSYIIPRYK